MDKVQTFVMIPLLIIMITLLSMVVLGQLTLSTEMARVQAEAIEDCYMVNCTYNFFGSIKCQIVPIEINWSKSNIGDIDGLLQTNENEKRTGRGT